MRQNAFGGQAPPGPARWGSFSAPPYPLAAIGGVPTSKAGGKRKRKGKEGDGEGKARKGKAG